MNRVQEVARKILTVIGFVIGVAFIVSVLCNLPVRNESTVSSCEAAPPRLQAASPERLDWDRLAAAMVQIEQGAEHNPLNVWRLARIDIEKKSGRALGRLGRMSPGDQVKAYASIYLPGEGNVVSLARLWRYGPSWRKSADHEEYGQRTWNLYRDLGPRL